MTQEEIEKLRAELVNLRHGLGILEEEKEELVALNQELEEQNSILTSLVVAFHRLYSCRDYVEVVRVVKEILINLIGVKRFEIHVVDKKKSRPVLVTREGEADAATTAEREQVEKTMKTGRLFIADEKWLQEKKTPVACIPLKVGGEISGIIVLYELLVQKKAFQKQDQELFELLGHHASMALYFGKLNWIIEAEVKRKLREGIEDLTPPIVASIRSIVSTLVENKRAADEKKAAE